MHGIMKNVVYNAFDTSTVSLKDWTDYISPLESIDTREAQLNQIFALQVVSQIMVHKDKTPQKNRQLQIRKWLFKESHP